MSILSNRIYYIDSEERISGTSSNFSFHLDIPDSAKFDSACVLSMTIPRSYYLVREGQNKFIFNLNSVDYPLTVPKGNYNVQNFRTMFIDLIKTATGANLTMAFDQITGKYEYHITPAAKTQGDFAMASIRLESPSRLGHQLGFDEVSINTFVSGLLTSKNVVNFVSTSTLFLHSDMVDDQTSILQEVYSDNSVPFSNLVYQCKFPTMYTKTLRTASSSTFNFSLQDEHGLEVDLNGHQMLFTLLLYRKENLGELIKKVAAIFVPE